MKEHNLKCWPEFFSRLSTGQKSFEVRKNDRDYQVGDILCIEEYDRYYDGYTGARAMFTITYCLHGGQFGIESGYVVLGLSPYDPYKRNTAG